MRGGAVFASLAAHGGSSLSPVVGRATGTVPPDTGETGDRRLGDRDAGYGSSPDGRDRAHPSTVALVVWTGSRSGILMGCSHSVSDQIYTRRYDDDG
ncbi:hypothetical protein K431DRAFT_128521 [Polychaeton citri CBS 116435]|uniref:Uncharacterized protein n=1 Tax=Polychaeton citri CBS 116435 TaxID=1314669 RepID=A0A9P4Q5B6_9PEZI|nr:hypothetical protein K431DRAFT_128521 [Polychaeton citri CBS 116435]